MGTSRDAARQRARVYGKRAPRKIGPDRNLYGPGQHRLLPADSSQARMRLQGHQEKMLQYGARRSWTLFRVEFAASEFKVVRTEETGPMRKYC